jgi:hypothetical protein
MPLIYFIPIRTPSGAIVYVADTRIDQTPLLLSSSGESTLYTTDASSNNFDISLVGSPTPSNNSPFSTNWSGYFGTNNYLNYAGNSALSFGTGDFTLECWIWISAPSDSPIYEGRASGTGSAAFTLTAFSSSVIRIWTGSSALISSTGTTYINKWTHVAVVRLSGTTTLYIGGVAAGSVATLGNLTENIALVGGGRYANTSTVNKYFNGYISNFRMVKGTAVYTANFTPTTLPLTAISGTSLLTLQNGSFVDNSPNAFTPTVAGAPSLTKFSPFTSTIGTNGSGYFNGTSTSLNLGNQAALHLGSGDFTVETWFYKASTVAQMTVCGDFGGSGTNTFSMLFDTPNGTKLQWWNAVTNTALMISNTVFNNFSWYHIAFVRSSNTLRLYVNGILDSSAAYSVNLNAITSFYIAQDPQLIAARSFIGHISNFRVVKGTAVYTANFTVPTSPLTAISGTSLLTLQNNTPNNTNAFLSSASNSTELAVVRTGNARTGSPNPYSFNYSNYFNGSSDYLTAASNTALNLKNFDFTVECWVYPMSTTYSTFQDIFTKRVTSSTTTSYQGYLRTGTGVISFYNGTNYESTTTLTTGVWSHCAWVYTNSNLTLQIYVNGTQVYSTTITGGIGADNAEPLTIGVARGYTEFFNGYISNFRIVKGTALYTTNFTSSTSPLEVVNGASLLTCQSARFVDNSPNRIALTAVSAPQVQPFNPFTMRAPSTPGTYSVNFDGSSGLSIASSAALAPTTGNFTYECWVYPTSSAASYRVIFGLDSYAVSSPFRMYQNNNKIELWYTNVSSIVSSTIAINTWHHIAMTRSSGSLRFFVNGIQQGSTLVTSVNYAASTFRIGRDSGGTYPFIGQISNLRVMNSAQYTENFTPTTSPLTAITGTLLLTCQRSTFDDNSSNAFAITATGTPVPTVQNPFNSTTPSSPTGYVASTYDGSMFFDGTGDYLTIASPPEYLRNWWLYTGFTIEAWVYVNTLTQDATNAVSPMVGHYTPTAATNYWSFGPITNGTVKFTYFTGTGQSVTTTATIGTRQWHHLAMVKNGTSLTIYINGLSSATATVTGTPQTLSTTPIIIGGYNNAVFNGYITDLRISSTAVYTTNFVPTTAPLTTTSNTLLLINPSSQAITDSTAHASIDSIGQVRVSNNVVKYGNSSIYFNGSSYCTLPYSTALNMPKDFTIETWVYPIARLTSFPCVLNNYSTFGANGGFAIFAGHNTSGSTKYNVYFNGANIINSTSTIVYNQWTHLALVRSGTTITLYVNGVSAGTSASQSATLVGTANSWWIGTAGDLASTSYFNGYISDLRVTRAARYTANFTPPTAALPT